MNVLDIATSCGVTSKKVSSSKGGEYASACPMCGGRDRFRIWPEEKDYGSWWCRGCGKGGDAIQLVIEAKGMGYKEACQYLGIGVKGPARGRGRARSPRVPKDRGASWAPRETHDPADLWQRKAAASLEAAQKALEGNKEQLAWLAARGISIETARRFGLGWNAKDLWLKKTAWGLEEDGKKLWLPQGLVIPWHMDGHLHRLRVRRSAPDVEPRYLIIAGSGSSPMMIWLENVQKGSGVPWTVVESELDALLIAAVAGDVTGVMAMGNSSAKPDEAAAAALEGALFIIDALDYDTAGGKASRWWLETYPAAERWPVPEGKDPGDFRKAGGDVREWVIAGLPPGLRPASEPAPAAPAPAAVPKPAVEEDDGRTPYVTEETKCTKCGRAIEYHHPAHEPGLSPKCWACLPPLLGAYAGET